MRREASTPNNHGMDLVLAAVFVTAVLLAARFGWHLVGPSASVVRREQAPAEAAPMTSLVRIQSFYSDALVELGDAPNCAETAAKAMFAGRMLVQATGHYRLGKMSEMDVLRDVETVRSAARA